MTSVEIERIGSPAKTSIEMPHKPEDVPAQVSEALQAVLQQVGFQTSPLGRGDDCANDFFASNGEQELRVIFYCDD